MFLLIIVSFSCEKQGLLVDCNECKTTAPTDATLKVRLDSTPGTGTVIVNVYEGNLEDNVIFSSVNTYSSSITIPVPPNKKYTLTATYNITDSQYIAVDSATPRVRYEKNQCNNPCYYIYDTSIDLRLKL